MKNLMMKPYRILGLSSMILLSVVSIGWSVEYNLRADVTTVNIPNGTPLGEDVTLWGFALGDGPVTVPGPVLRVPAGDTTLTVHLTNNLTPLTTGIPMGCPASVVIPGQIAALSPVRFGPMPYPQFEGRIRNVTYDTPPGGTMDYTWTNLKPGSYPYFSGNHLACHVQMGLYGAMIHDAPENPANPGIPQAYPGVPYDNEVIIFYSEIDPDFHTAVATLNYGPGKAVTSTMEYNPRYYLVNGQPYQAGQLPLPAGQVNQRTLLRLFNMGLETHVPVLQNLRATVLAEDGYPYAYPKDQSSIVLPAGKSADAIVIPSADGIYPVLDRRLRLTNHMASPGGLLAFLEVSSSGMNVPPVIDSVTASPAAIFDSQTSQLAVAATDPDAGPSALSYQWTVAAGEGTLSDPTIANPTYTPPDVAGLQTYILGVQVSDGQDTASGTVSIAVYDALILSANFDVNADGFTYIDDAFRGTANPAYASGGRLSGGIYAGTMRVHLGGNDNVLIANMSGGLRRTFTIPVSTPVRVSFRYQAIQTPYYEATEYTEALLSLDGVLIGVAPNDYLARIFGNGDGGPSITTGWVLAELDLGVLAPGTHTLILGGFNNQKDSTLEYTDVIFDDVVVSAGAPVGNAAPVIASVSATPSVIFDTQTSQLLVNAIDVDGPAPISFAWTVPAGAGSLNDTTIANPSYIPPDLPAGSPDQLFTISVTATDGLGAVSTATVGITVRDYVNVPPVINSVTASPAAIFDSQTSQLAVAATDPDAGPSALSYQWTVAAGEGTLSDPTIANPTYTPPDVAGLQTYILGVQVSDGQDTASGTVSIAVYDALILSANFDVNADGFTYIDDAFRGTANPAYASGGRLSGGIYAGTMRVHLGGNDNVLIANMSGGLRRTFTIPVSTPVRVSFRYQAIQTPYYEATEYTEALLSLDGVLIGVAPNDYLARIFGNGDGGPSITTGWVLAELDLGVLAPGTHTLILGGFNNQKDSTLEYTDVIFDDVVVSAGAPVPPPTAGLLSQLTSVCPGDYDRDGDVDGDDLNFFKIYWAARDLLADLDGDGRVSLADLGIFKDKFENGC